MVRDLLVRENPIVLHPEIYAVAGLAGAVVIVLGRYWGLPPVAVTALAAVAGCGLRLISLRQWHLPIVGPVN